MEPPPLLSYASKVLCSELHLFGTKIVPSCSIEGVVMFLDRRSKTGPTMRSVLPLMVSMDHNYDPENGRLSLQGMDGNGGMG